MLPNALKTTTQQDNDNKILAGQYRYFILYWSFRCQTAQPYNKADKHDVL